MKNCSDGKSDKGNFWKGVNKINIVISNATYKI